LRVGRGHGIGQIDKVLGRLDQDRVVEIGLEILVPAPQTGRIEHDDEAAGDAGAGTQRVRPAVERAVQRLARHRLAGVTGEELGDLAQFRPGVRHGERPAVGFLEGRLLVRVVEEVLPDDQHRCRGRGRERYVLAGPGLAGHVRFDDELRIGVDVETVLFHERREVHRVVDESAVPAGAVIAQMPATGAADRLDRHLVPELVRRQDLADHPHTGLPLVLGGKVFDDGVGLLARMQRPADLDILGTGCNTESGECDERDCRGSAARDGFHVHFGYIPPWVVFLGVIGRRTSRTRWGRDRCCDDL